MPDKLEVHSVYEHRRIRGISHESEGLPKDYRSTTVLVRSHMYTSLRHTNCCSKAHYTSKHVQELSLTDTFKAHIALPSSS